ncbi:DJ-1/PfpI family protein [Rhodanobacter sp. 7MK24]|uniref:GlxA family transcriptional regulator n=1 Tax=Rhodanobacter sp. 7MK24 TaxID=2775922 RepID=UPI00177E009C|nr:DJ-1/PfpI family protein [Rhodanobacter sp. 7MK24]MBD8879763.1 DJ-1/PfpI family protein [Rhodanobacter sp. 7MK24]
MPSAKIVAFVLFEDALALNIAGPAEVFGSANRLSGESSPLYELIYLSTAGNLVRTSSGVAIQTQSLASVNVHELDTVIVVGGVTVAEAMRDTVLVEWIAHASTIVRRTCSVCTGAFLLASARLLDGRRAVTHWASVDELLAQFPAVQVQLDPIYVNDGNIWTSAGISAGIDLALTLVEVDHDRRLSLAVAKDLVVFLHRPGGQAQFSRTLATQAGAGTRKLKSQLETLHVWIVEHLDEELSIERLAARMKMTPRTFARKFVDQYGRTPAKLIEDLRLETACRHLEENHIAIKQIAFLCGFGDEERMRRAFMRRLRVPPASYREQFAAAI